MAESGSYNLGFRLDIKQILSEAQNRWLRPAEICEILRNHEKFHISPEAPNKPVSGSVFLFNRKILRYFRKDAHNWRKKKDGKTVKEAHEKLKVGSVDMLNCYYAHGEDDENLQRRSYWLLETDLMHIVFVHYLEVKGNKTNNSYARNSDRVVPNSENESSLTSSFRGTSPTSTLSSAYEDAESESNHQASNTLHSYSESPSIDDTAQSSSYNQLFNSGVNKSGGGSLISGAQITDGLPSWQEILPDHAAGETAYGQESQCFLPAQDNWQVLNALHEQKFLPSDQGEQTGQRNIQMFLSDTDTGNATNSNMEDGMTLTGSESYSFHLRKPLINGLQTEDGLKKVDSFSRWIAKEIGEGGDLDMQSSNGLSWGSMGSEYDPIMSAQLQVDTHTLNPSVSQDQLFTIIDFSPSWAYSTLDTKVLITGKFLTSSEEFSRYRWSIMFGEMEVQADVLADGILCCCAPLQNPGLVPFYVTCSNRLACSELREFEYRSGPDQIIGSINSNGDNAIVMHLYQRFEMILHREPVGSPIHSGGNEFEKLSVTNKIISMMEENDLEAEISEYDGSHLKVIGEMLLKKHLKEKFYFWLLSRAADDGKGLTMIDERGQNVLHLAAALGFDWAIQPIIVSGVSIDFRDVNGFTALHWAAAYGREDVVAVLVSLGASPGPLTDPSAEYPLGRTPADLASSSGHKGISGFLAETSLTSHLSTLRVNDGGTAEVSSLEPIQTVSERLAVPRTGADVPDTLSLKDSLAAVCNATQAAARIHQIFRIQSFQRKKLIDQEESDELLTPDAISLVAAKPSRLGHSDGMANTAALQIQKKYRGWKKRKEFLLIRQKIVKIQAHVRGHQVRKKYKPIIWSVGILEKVILRWRRKRSGLRGFRSDAVQKEPDAQPLPVPEDDYDVLKEGRKQTEERMQKALARVQSMAQNPEGRAQYRRLLTAAEGFRENQEGSDMSSMFPEMMSADEELLDISSLLDDDTFMSLAFE
ncbi:calmodulin-binding transcription activator 2-like isoform X1 [Salvia splendens]|uniref:calmodulin-binding transcription activator 2-like isoform X1 n=2 Tax=Salvia splendens TaxID=180675 RepID=UPI001C25F41E|nr:calmodulin-binding transcription activator 2-like isoform X1 [Salvia splendens]